MLLVDMLGRITHKQNFDSLDYITVPLLQSPLSTENWQLCVQLLVGVSRVILLHTFMQSSFLRSVLSDIGSEEPECL